MIRKLFYMHFIVITNFSNADNNSEGFYAGIGTGYGNDAVLGRLFIGYMLNRIIGVETAYTFWGTSTQSINVNSHILNYGQQPQSLEGQIVLSLPLGVSPLSLHGKFGLAYIYINGNNVSQNDYSINTIPGGSGVTSVGGIGMGLNFAKNIKLDLDWVSYGFIEPVNILATGNNAAKWLSNNIELNLSYHF